MMGSIYENASRVMVYLGPVSEHTESALKTVKQIASNRIQYGIGEVGKIVV